MEEKSNEGKKKLKDVYVYENEWPVYGLAISERQDTDFRFCISSCIESEKNHLQIIELDSNNERLVRVCGREHVFPATKCMFLPSNLNSNPDLLATSSDYIRVFKASDQSIRQQSCLDSNKNTKFCGPLTSFDWCRTDLSRMVTCSIDTTVMYWDMKREKLVSQLIAHDKEVYDVNFRVHSKFHFASCGADSTVRMFDLRNLEHSQLLYEDKNLSSILRVKWNKLRDWYLSVILLDSSKIVLLDQRMPTRIVAELIGHSKSVNSVDWAPHSSNHFISGGDDLQTFIWDTSKVLLKSKKDPLLGFSTQSPVNQVKWSHTHPDWICLVTSKKLQMLRV